MTIQYFEVGVDVENFKEWLTFETSVEHVENLTNRELIRAMKEYIYNKFEDDNLPCLIHGGNK